MDNVTVYCRVTRSSGCHELKLQRLAERADSASELHLQETECVGLSTRAVPVLRSVHGADSGKRFSTADDNIPFTTEHRQRNKTCSFLIPLHNGSICMKLGTKVQKEIYLF